MLAVLASVLCVGVGCASRRDDLYRAGTAAYARGDWEGTRTALNGFVSLECQFPSERANCRGAKLELARAELRSGHRAAAVVTFESVLQQSSPVERQAVAAERDAALVAMRTELGKSKERLPVLLRFRDQARSFQAQAVLVFVDRRKVFETRVLPGNLKAESVSLTSISLEVGEHLLEARVHFANRPPVGPAPYAIVIRSPLQVTGAPVVVEFASGDATGTVTRFGSPTLDLVVRQGTGGQPTLALPNPPLPAGAAPTTGPPEPIPDDEPNSTGTNPP